ncbi:MAG: hypothetical protein MZU95_07285 [Desulfomicrobium escambiense]|nr:hypothetical protein [Desulfomicrobium escambiense]
MLVEVGAVEVGRGRARRSGSARAPSRGSRRCPRWWQRVDEEHEVLRRARSGWSARSSRWSGSPRNRRRDAPSAAGIQRG